MSPVNASAQKRLSSFALATQQGQAGQDKECRGYPWQNPPCLWWREVPVWLVVNLPHHKSEILNKCLTSQNIIE